LGELERARRDVKGDPGTPMGEAALGVTLRVGVMDSSRLLFLRLLFSV
jgi:hypothetical protein